MAQFTEDAIAYTTAHQQAKDAEAAKLKNFPLHRANTAQGPDQRAKIAEQEKNRRHLQTTDIATRRIRE